MEDQPSLLNAQAHKFPILQIEKRVCLYITGHSKSTKTPIVNQRNTNPTMEVDPTIKAAERTMEAALTTHRDAHHLPITNMDNPTEEEDAPRKNRHEMTWKATPPKLTALAEEPEASKTTPNTAPQVHPHTRTNDGTDPTETDANSMANGQEMDWRAEFTVPDTNKQQFVLDTALMQLLEPMFADNAPFQLLSNTDDQSYIDRQSSFPAGQNAMNKYFQWHKNGHTWFVGFRVRSSRRLEQFKESRDFTVSRHMKELGAWLEEHYFESLDIVLAGWYKDRHPDWYHRQHTQQRLQWSVNHLCQQATDAGDTTTSPRIEVNSGTVGRSYQPQGATSPQYFRTRAPKIVCDRRKVQHVRRILATEIVPPDAAGLFVPWGGNTGISLTRDVQFIASNNMYQANTRRTFVHNILPDSLVQPTVNNTIMLRDQLLRILDSQQEPLFASIERTNQSNTR
jgi:hypothetical protein